MSKITTHVLDTARGRPAPGVAIVLSVREGEGWREISRGATDADGRLRTLLPDGEPLATLFLVRSGTRVVEPYGGMTAEGGESRANYLLKWEAIRSSREQGATSYDLWGLATGGIAHFKTGFGGREIRYIGAWDLVLDPFGIDVSPALVDLADDGGPTGASAYGLATASDTGSRPIRSMRSLSVSPSTYSKTM